ncbi:MAG: hypothetical protein AAFR12_14870 [Cyanobacteria bacterium J06626_6]
MNNELDKLTNNELKAYISEHRNDTSLASAALELLLSRQDPEAPVYPYSLGLNGSEHELRAVLEEKLKEVQ